MTNDNPPGRVTMTALDLVMGSLQRHAFRVHTVVTHQVQPRWFIEGYATHMESSETSGGRLRSTIFEMFLRMATLEAWQDHGLAAVMLTPASNRHVSSFVPAPAY